MNNKTLAISLFFIWGLLGSLKILFTFNVFLFPYEDILHVVNSLFVLIGILIILLRCFTEPLRLNYQLFILIALFTLSLVNTNIFAFIFSFLIWYSVSGMVSPRNFRFIYLINLGMLIFLFYISVKLNGETYYYDQRYGNVKSFGFENSNSFPQLLIVFYLMSTTKIRWLLSTAFIFVILFLGDIETRSFYFILILYPLSLLLFKYYLSRYISLLPIMLFFGSILLVYMYASQMALAVKIDEYLSYRVSFANIILSTMPGLYTQFFGLGLSSVNEYLPMDLSYTAIIFTFGFIPALLLMIMYSQTLKILISKKNYTLVALITTFLLYGLVENVLISFILNPTLYYVFYTSNNKGKQQITTQMRVDHL